MNQNTPATQLNDLLVTRDLDPELLDNSGKPVSDPNQTEIFSFDWKTENKNYGTVVVLLGPNNTLQVFFGDNVGRTMEGDDKSDWYKFLEQLKNFATRNLLSFELNNLSRLKYTMQGMAAIKEGLFEGYYGKKNISYSDQPMEARLMIKHSRDIAEGEARFRAIESLFVETADGSRYKLPHKNLMCGKVMARHCSEGGHPYDALGQHINGMVVELNTLGRFIRAARHKNLNDDAHGMVESAVRHYTELKNKAKHMISRRGYLETRDTFDPAEISEKDHAVESIRDLFVEQSIDQRIEEALPILAKLANKEDKMKEVDQFESWADNVMEGTWALPDTPESDAKLKELMSKPLIVGADATNATEQLYDLVGDDILFDRLNDLADRDPNADCWQDPEVINRLGELGIDINSTVGSNSGEQGMTEGARQGIMLNGKEVDMRSLEIENVDSRDYPDFSDAYISRASFTDGTDLSDQEMDQLNDEHGDLVNELAYDSLHESDLGEDIDTDGVMMTKSSNMSSESIERMRQLSGLNEGWKGELAGGTAGGVGGTVAGSALGALAGGPVGAAIGGVIGGAAGGTAGQMAGRELSKENKLSEAQLDEIAPIIPALAAGARMLLPILSRVGPALGRMATKTGKAGAEVAGKAATGIGKGAVEVGKSAAQSTAQNAGKVGLGAGVYSIADEIAKSIPQGMNKVYTDAKDAAGALTSIVGNAIDSKTIGELAMAAAKYAIPLGLLLAVLYGGKKLIDQVMSEGADDTNMGALGKMVGAGTPNPSDFVQGFKKTFEESTSLQGQYGHSGKLQKFDDMEQDVLSRLRQLSGMMKS